MEPVVVVAAADELPAGSPCRARTANLVSAMVLPTGFLPKSSRPRRFVLPLRVISLGSWVGVGRLEVRILTRRARGLAKQATTTEHHQVIF